MLELFQPIRFRNTEALFGGSLAWKGMCDITAGMSSSGTSGSIVHHSRNDLYPAFGHYRAAISYTATSVGLMSSSRWRHMNSEYGPLFIASIYLSRYHLGIPTWSAVGHLLMILSYLMMKEKVD